MSTENLSFKIALSGTYWDKRPEYKVLLDGQLIKHDTIQAASGVNENIEFHSELIEGVHELRISLLNKTHGDTVRDTENPEVFAKDMLLNVADIEIDEISVGPLLWSAEYEFDEPHEVDGALADKMSHCVNMGWNGTYVFKFESPFYLWLLEKL